MQDVERDDKRQLIEEMEAFLEGQTDLSEEYDEQLVRQLIERVIIYDEKIAVKFKSGVEIEVEK